MEGGGSQSVYVWGGLKVREDVGASGSMWGLEAWSGAENETTGFFENRRSSGGLQSRTSLRCSTFEVFASHFSFYSVSRLKLQRNEKQLHNP